MSDVIASPSVRALAAQKGIDLETLASDLGRQTIGREDLEGTSSRVPTSSSLWDVDHSEWGPVREEPVSRFAQLSARNLSDAATLIPAVTHHDSADVTSLEAFRASAKKRPSPRACGSLRWPSILRRLRECCVSFHDGTRR